MAGAATASGGLTLRSRVVEEGLWFWGAAVEEA